MGAYHGWGLGTRPPVRRKPPARRALTLVVDTPREVGRVPVKLRAVTPARRDERSRA